MPAILTKRNRGGSAVLWLVAALVVPAPAAAQSSAEAGVVHVGAFAGAYVPTADAIAEGSARVKQGMGPVLGARVSYGLGPRLAFEAVLAAATGDVDGSGPMTLTVSGRNILATARARWRVREAGSAWPLHLSGGFGVVSHGGDAYGVLDGSTDLAFVLGVGVERPLRDRVLLRIDLEDHIYSAQFSFGAAESASQLQNDLQLSAGVSYLLTGRRTVASR